MGGLRLPDFKTYYEATVIKTVRYCQKNRKIYQWNRTDSPEIDIHIHSQLIFDKGEKTIQWSKNIFSANDAETTGHLHAKNEPIHRPHTKNYPSQKLTQDFPGGTVVKNLPANEGDMGSIPGLGRSHMPWSS